MSDFTSFVAVVNTACGDKRSFKSEKAGLKWLSLHSKRCPHGCGMVKTTTGEKHLIGFYENKDSMKKFTTDTKEFESTVVFASAW